MQSRTEALAYYQEVIAEAEATAAPSGPEALERALDDVMAELDRTDLFYLLTHTLNRTDINCDWLYERCRDVQSEPDGMLDLWAREHYKSTIITFGLTIQDILNDPEITVGIFSHTRPIAKAFLNQIMQEFEQNERLKKQHPDVLWENPRREAPRWSLDSGIVVRRKTNPKEATIEAWGLVDGQPTSKHFSLLDYDDVVTLSSVTTPDQIAKTTEAWEMSLNLGAEGGRIRYIGTRYHFNDTWGTIIRRGSATPRIFKATDSGKPEGNPVFMSPEALAKKRRDMGSYVFACQMLQDPKADDAQGFLKEWLRPWTPKREHWARMNIYIVVDPAGEKKIKNTNTDYTVMWVIGLGPDERYYLIDGVRDRLNLTQRTEHLFRLVRQYKPICVGYEKYGLQSDIEHIEYEQNLKTYHFNVIELGGQMPKNDRIRRLVPPFEHARFYTPGVLPFCDAEGAHRDLMREFEEEEFLAFPVSVHDDMLDCMARILDQDLGASFPDYDAEAHLKGGLPNMPVGNQSNGVDFDPMGAW